MADSVPDIARKPRKAALLIGVILALAGGAGGFLAVQSGLLAGGGRAPDDHSTAALTIAFVALDPLVISLPASNGRDHLRFAAQLEVPQAYVAEVTAVKPRIVDILNSYLRAVDLAELEDPTSLLRLRSQMLRRIQVITGEGRVNDLLIMEFVLS